MIARFGAFELDLQTRELRKRGVRVHVPPQSVEVLATLIERPGQLVTRDEIRERLWPHGTIVEFEHSVNSAIKRLRDALCDSADSPRFIETLPRYGYRLLVPVEKHEPAVVRGHFRILGEAGRGAMGVVYRAEDLQLGRTVALKVLPDELSEYPPALEQLRREGRICASLNHPGICTLYGVDQHDGHFCLVMEYLEGQPLSRILEGGPLGVDHALRVGIQAAEALETAHSRGIIHGDIKPSNLFLTASGQLKLTDFGIATRIGSGSLTMCGTPGYVSPEQAEGKLVDGRSDVFALGCVLFEMITGRRASPVSPGQGLEGLGPELQTIVIRCLQRIPDARFQTMSELKCALQELREAPDARRLTVPAPAEAWPQRLLPGILGVLLTAVLATAVAGWWSISRKSAVTAPPRTPGQVTSYPGIEAAPTLSPDGNQVAFSANIEDPNNFDIYVKIIGSEPALRLTRDPEADTSPAWSPDGRWVAFVRGDRLLLVSPLGGPERMVVENLAGEPGYTPWVTWSHDSQNVIAAIRTTPEQQPIIFAISIATGERRRLHWPHAAGQWGTVLSTSGHKLAFLRFEPNRVAAVIPIPHLYVARLSSTLDVGQLRLVDWGTPDRVGGCAWTAGDRDLVCALPLPDGRMALWRIETERASPPQVLPYTENAWGPVIAGGRLVFERFKRDADIWRAESLHGRSPGSAPVRFISSTAFDIHPQYAPDGKSIAFLSNRSGSLEVWVTRADGADPRMLTSLRKVDWEMSPQWSPDGKSILFTNNNDMYVIDAAGGVPKRLVCDPVLKASSPSYSHDGKWIYFSSKQTGRPEVWRLPAAGGSAAPITKTGGMQPLESPDGQYLLFVKQESKGVSLWRMPSSGGPESRVLEQLSTFYWSYAFAAGRLFCIRQDNRDNPMAVEVVDPASGAIRRLRTLNAPQRSDSGGLSVSSDGRWFLYTVGEAQGDLVQFENFR